MVHSLCSMLACSGLEKSRKMRLGGREKKPILGLFQPATAPTVLRYSPNKKGQKTQHKRHSRMVHSLCGIPARSRLEKSWKKRLGGQKSQARGSG